MDNLEKQGDKLFKSGKKELKTGLFKWKPDYDAAVSKFEEATKFFKNAQKWEKALESLEKQVFCCKQTVDDWGVARGLESIVQIQCDHPEIIKDETKLNDQAKEAAQYFKVSQSYTNLIKLYKLVSNFYIETRHDRKKALDFAKQAYEDSLESDQSYNVTEIIDFYIDLLCQNEMYVDAIKVYRQQTELLKNTDSKTPLEQYALLSIALCLVLNDSIQANKELEYYICEVPKIGQTSEYQSCVSMINHYENGEQEEFIKKVTRPPINMQHPPIIPRLLKKVKCQQQQYVQENQAQQQQDQVEKDLQNAIF